MIYRRNADGGLQLESAEFGGGRIVASEGASGVVYTPNYFITDHLGSTRAVVNAQGNVIEQNDYYPFGSRHENPQLAVSDNRFRFSGKEDQTIGDLPYQDFTARFFGKKLPIFTTPDPLSEIDYPISPYAYCRNNPIRHIDTDGRHWVDANGKKMWENGSYTRYATVDFIRGANAMRSTEIGRSVFNDVANISANIRYAISPKVEIRTNDGVNTLIKGEFIPRPDQPVNSNGKVTLRDGDIIIYEGSIQAEVDGTKKVGGKTHDLIMALPVDQALEGAIGATSVHEGLHTTPKNVQQAYENTEARRNGRPAPHDNEKEPKEGQNRHLEELLIKIKNRKQP